MPPIYTVRARVIDIRRDTPRTTDAMVLDSNTWYWTKSPGVGVFPGRATATQLTEYGAYSTKIGLAGATRYHTGLTLAEVSHLIEEDERTFTRGMFPL